MPDRDGNFADVVLGFDERRATSATRRILAPSLAAWPTGSPTRPSARRRDVPPRDQRGRHARHAHGGARGFDKVAWNVLHRTADKVVLEYTSADGEGYPGELHVKVRYELTARSELVFEVTAHTTKPTPINIAQHSYFNLGHGSGSVPTCPHATRRPRAAHRPSDPARIAARQKHPRLPHAATHRRRHHCVDGPAGARATTTASPCTAPAPSSRATATVRRCEGAAPATAATPQPAATLHTRAAVASSRCTRRCPASSCTPPTSWTARSSARAVQSTRSTRACAWRRKGFRTRSTTQTGRRGVRPARRSVIARYTRSRRVPCDVRS